MNTKNTLKMSEQLKCFLDPGSSIVRLGTYLISFETDTHTVVARMSCKLLLKTMVTVLYLCIHKPAYGIARRVISFLNLHSLRRDKDRFDLTWTFAFWLFHSVHNADHIKVLHLTQTRFIYHCCSTIESLKLARQTKSDRRFCICPQQDAVVLNQHMLEALLYYSPGAGSTV